MIQETPQALEALHEVSLPEPISLLPQTAAWYVVFAMLLAGVAWAVIRWARHRRGNRYRRAALARLGQIERALDGPGEHAAVMQIPELVKRTALGFAPRDQVAELSGDRWLAFLDRSYGGSGFSQGPGRLLSSIAYARPSRSQQIPASDLAALVSLIRTWIGGHRARA